MEEAGVAVQDVNVVQPPALHHIHRPGRRACIIRPQDYSMSDAVAIMTGAMQPPVETVH